MKRQTARCIGLLLILLVVLTPLAASAQKSLSDGIDDLANKLAKSFGDGTKGKVAIVPMRDLAGGENLLGTYIAEILTNSFFEAGYRDVVERQMLDRALQELKLNFTGMVDQESAKKIGKFLNADFVVGGTMTELTGEVSVICRMFAVETGEVVAVAQTKIVKDDSVKSMLSRGMESPVKTAHEPPDEGRGGDLTQEALGVSFRLKSCSYRREVVDCVVAITATEGDVYIRLSRNSRLEDSSGQGVGVGALSFSADQGAQGRAARFGAIIGEVANLDLSRGITRTGHIRFEGVHLEKGEVPLIEIRFSRLRRSIGDGAVQFRNVKVN